LRMTSRSRSSSARVRLMKSPIISIGPGRWVKKIKN
jgi:hypothetical protein